MNSNYGHMAGERKKSNILGRLVIFVLLIFIAMAVTTQFFAYSMAYQSALGSNFHNLYFPWEIAVWMFNWYGENPGLFSKSLSVGTVVLASEMMCWLIYIIFQSRTAKANASLHGSARWAEKTDIEKAGLLSDEGVFVGAWEDKKGVIHYLRHNGPEHILCFAPTRSGKGVGLVVPTLLTWPHSAVISDLKGELYDMTAGWRKKYAGQTIIRFEPASGTGSARWNPLSEVRIETEYEVGDVQNLALLIVDPDGKGLNDHWQKTAFALLAGCILHLLYKEKEGGERATFSTLDGMLANPSRPINELWEEMATNMHLSGEQHPVVARAGQDMLDRPEEEAGSVLSTAKSFLSLYRDPVVSKNTEWSDFKIDDLMNHNTPVSLYIITKGTDKDRLRPLIRILISMIIRIQANTIQFVEKEQKQYSFFQRLVRFLQGKTKDSGGRMGKGVYKFRELLLLDEFPSLGKLDLIQEALSYIAGFGIKAYLICQDITQLRSREKGYGHDETLSSNCQVQNAFPPGRPETAEYLSKMTGTTTVVKEQISTSGKRLGLMMGNVTRNLQEVQRPLLTPDEAMRLAGPKKNGDMIVSPGAMLIFAAGYPAIFGKQPLYFLDDILAPRAAVPPPSDTDIIRPAPEAIDFDGAADEFDFEEYEEAAEA